MFTHKKVRNLRSMLLSHKNANKDFPIDTARYIASTKSVFYVYIEYATFLFATFKREKERERKKNSIFTLLKSFSKSLFSYPLL